MSKKKTETKEKSKKLNAVVSYEGEGELLSDISSSKPLKKKKTKKTTKEKVEEKVEIIKEIVVEKSEKEIFNEILESGDDFFLKHNGTIIYDSIENKESIIIFQKQGFILDGNKYSYTGLNLKFKK